MENGIEYVSVEGHTNPLHFVIEDGNGMNQIEHAFKKRFWWKNLQEKEDKALHFHWTQTRSERLRTTAST